MLGLGAYASSDDEDGVETIDEQGAEQKEIAPQSEKTTKPFSEPGKPEAVFTTTSAVKSEAVNVVESKAQDTGSLLERSAPQGPAMPSHDDSRLAEQISAPQSTYASAREAIRSLTMPPVPDFSVPPSPPGSPPVGATKKFEHFLKLKKQGVHFNSKLESSSALRNPALSKRLQEFANIDEWDQYASALPADVDVPTAYPPWAYSSELNKTQQLMQKKKEEHNSKHPRSKLDFVPGAVTRPFQGPKKRARQ